MNMPEHMTKLLDLALAPLPSGWNIAEPTRLLAQLVWQRWLAWRPPADNRAEHEFVVLANAVRIGLDERLSESELRIAAAFSLLHDTHYIPRITEARISEVERAGRTAREAGRLDEAVRLEDEARRLEGGKLEQRQRHMRGSAAMAELTLRNLRDDLGEEATWTQVEAEKCVAIIAGHDRWKLGEPHPASFDWLAVVCLEADALWPLHPLGVQADLERPREDGSIEPLHDPAAWRKQLEVSIRTLRRYRANWPAAGSDPFQDRESIFRTRAGHRMYLDWLRFWGYSP